MNFRKHSTLIIGLGIAVVLLVIAVVLLVGYRSAYMDSRAALDSARSRLSSLNNRNPFPSDANVQATREQLELVKSNYTGIADRLRANQLTVEAIEPAKFALLLEETVRRIRTFAASEGVSLPAEAGLGFKEYAAGKLPPNDPAVMDRLVVQIKAIEDLVALLIGAKINSIDGLQRDMFEVEAEAQPAAEEGGRSARSSGPDREAPAPVRLPGGIPAAPNSDLYSTERLTVEFTARESALWEALNRIAASKVTYVVVDMAVTSTAANLGKPVDLKAKFGGARSGGTPGQPAATVALDSIPREERIIGGREPLKVKLVVDMYRFHETVGGEGAP